MSNNKFKKNNPFNVGGMKQRPTPTKQEMIKGLEAKVESIVKTLNQVLMINAQSNARIMGTLQEMKQQLEVIDYRSLSTADLVVKKEIFTKDEHASHSDTLRVKDFKKASASDDVARKLQPLPKGTKSEKGHVMTIRLWATDKETNEEIEKLSLLRSKIDLGAGVLSSLEDNLVGLQVGETKEFEAKLGQEFQEFKDKDVKFKVTVFDLKLAPKPTKPDVAKSNMIDKIQKERIDISKNVKSSDDANKEEAAKETPIPSSKAVK